MEFIYIASLYFGNNQPESLKNLRGVFRTHLNMWDGAFCEKIVDGFQPLTIFSKSSILHIRLAFECTS